MKYFSIYFLSIFFLTTISFAQEESKRNFETGKVYLSQKNYLMASEAFKVAAQNTDNNPYKKYGSYYLALSEFHQGKFEESKLMLLQILDKYSDWDKIDEAKYLLSTIYLKQKNYPSAFALFSQISNSSFRQDIYKLKRNEFSLLKTKEVFELYKEYRDDAAVAETFADQLANPSNDFPNKEKLLSEILYEFGYKPQIQKKNSSTTNVQSHPKDFRIAFLMPFQTQQFDSTLRYQKNQFVIDMYTGMQIGKNHLAESGLDVSLVPYDTERSKSRSNYLLGLDEMKSFDLMVGPIYPETFPDFVSFAKKNKIAMLNPFSSNESLLKEYEDLFLAQATYPTVAHKIATFAKDSLTDLKVYIFFGESKKDSLLAQAYKEVILAMKGEVLCFEKVVASKNTLKSIQNQLKPLAESLGLHDRVFDPKLTIYEQLLHDKNHHMFVSSSDQALAASIMSTLQTYYLNIPIFVSEEWLNFTTISYEQLNMRSLYFYLPNYVNPQLDIYKEFVSEYLLKYKQLPSMYALLGYDCIRLFGSAYKEFGPSYLKQLKSGYQLQDPVTPGINFLQGRDNQDVPIYRFVDFNLLRQN